MQDIWTGVKKMWGYIIGALLYTLPSPLLKPFIGGSDTKSLKGICAPNADGDSENIKKFQADIVRIAYKEGELRVWAKFAELNNLKYYIILGDGSQTAHQHAELISKALKELEGTYLKPEFFALVNEDNNYSWALVGLTIQNLKIDYNIYNVVVTKGSHTSIVESAGMKAYFNYFKHQEELFTELPHLVHFYLKYNDGKWTTKISNLMRKWLLTYMLFRLNKVGVPASDIIISESHDGTKEIPNMETHGDFVYATKEGWLELEELANKLGIKAILYYQAPFLSYRGNAVL